MLKSVCPPEEIFTTEDIAICWHYSSQTLAGELDFAVRYNLANTIQAILKVHPALVQDSTRALSLACLMGNLELVKLMVDKYQARVNPSEKDVENHVCPPIINAISTKHNNGDLAYQLVTYLHAHGANLNVHYACTACSKTPLHACLSEMENILPPNEIQTSYFPLLKYLVQHGANADLPMELKHCSLREYIQALQQNPDFSDELADIFASPETTAITTNHTPQKLSPP